MSETEHILPNSTCNSQSGNYMNENVLDNINAIFRYLFFGKLLKWGKKHTEYDRNCTSGHGPRYKTTVCP